MAKTPEKGSLGNNPKNDESFRQMDNLLDDLAKRSPRINSFFNFPEAEATSRVTFSTAFQNANLNWFDITIVENGQERVSINKIKDLTGKEQGKLMFDYFIPGLEYLSLKPDNEFIRITAERALSMLNDKAVHIKLTTNIRDTAQKELNIPKNRISIVVPRDDMFVFNVKKYKASEPAIIYAPYKWIQTAFRQPLQGLVYLLQFSSFCRDKYFDKLTGTTKYPQSDGKVLTYDNYDISAIRADVLVAEMLHEASVKAYFNPLQELNDRSITLLRNYQDGFCCEGSMFMYRDFNSPQRSKSDDDMSNPKSPFGRLPPKIR
jgi:hypothetical protein